MTLPAGVEWFWPEWFTPVQRLRQVGLRTDPRGVPVRGSGTVEVTDLPGALVAPQTTTEGPDAGREAGDVAVYTSATLYFPSSKPDIRPSDRLQFNNAKWSVKGDPKVYPLGMSVVVEKEVREWPLG